MSEIYKYEQMKFHGVQSTYTASEVEEYQYMMCRGNQIGKTIAGITYQVESEWKDTALPDTDLELSRSKDRVKYWCEKAEYWESEARKLQERLDASQNVVNALDERLDIANQRVNAVEDQSVKQAGLYLSLNKMETDLGKLREAIGSIKFNEILTDGDK